MNGVDHAQNTSGAMATGKGYTTPKSETNCGSCVFSSKSWLLFTMVGKLIQGFVITKNPK